MVSLSLSLSNTRYHLPSFILNLVKCFLFCFFIQLFIVVIYLLCSLKLRMIMMMIIGFVSQSRSKHSFKRRKTFLDTERSIGVLFSNQFIYAFMVILPKNMALTKYSLHVSRYIPLLGHSSSPNSKGAHTNELFLSPPLWG